MTVTETADAEPGDRAEAEEAVSEPTATAAEATAEEATAEESAEDEKPSIDEPTEEASPEDESGERDFGEPVESDRGFLVKDIGQWAGIDSEGGALVDFRVIDIETDFTCTSEWSEASANGQFVSLSIEVETYAALADEMFGEFMLTEYDLAVFDESGTRENDSTGNAYMCLADSDQLPSMIGPGQKATGMLVIDTAVESGVIAYESYSLDGSGGWEWSF